jgi:hypothetical protein
MDERFFHYLWKFRLLFPQLRLTSGEILTVLHPGDYNRDGGPDFFNARIRIGDTTWAGNIEIHGKSSDWFRHGHHLDKAYENVVLHVVVENDREVRTENNRLLPTLEIKDQYPETLIRHYRGMMSGQRWIPCQLLLNDLNKQDISLWMTVLILERLEKKARFILPLFNSCGDDWEETLYRFLAYNFGFRINGLPFELLAKSLPLKFLTRQGNSLFRKEALLFGMSGLLSQNAKDDYPRALAREFQFLRDKYQLSPISSGLWKFLRLRPSNFPTIRLSQWAAFLHQHEGNLFEMLCAEDLSAWHEKFRVKASVYWDDHFIFDKHSYPKPKLLGESSIDLIIMNALVPFLFFYSRQKSDKALADKVLLFLEQLPGEINFDIKMWENAGLSVRTALHTQALIQLKRNYCDVKRCLECRIGHKILKTKWYEKSSNDKGLPVI